MFSFHKPKIYRSNAGCCICKAKSSSSRFTDSKKYEAEFERCFRIQEQRSGEICNACVLLVKRWKKLSPENRCVKHWHHVVDARAGPATKLANVARGRHAGHHRLFAKQASPSSVAAAASTLKPTALTSAGDQEQKVATEQTTIVPKLDRQAGFGKQQPQQQSFQHQNHHLTQQHAACKPLASIQSPAIGTRRAYQQQQQLQRPPTITTSNYHPQRRSYMTHAPKSNSALSSTAFEEVILRFRQRQQQEQRDTKRRQQMRKQQRLNRADDGVSNAEQSPQSDSSQFPNCQSVAAENDDSNEAYKSTVEDEAAPASESISNEKLAARRAKRYSDSVGSVCVDGFRVSSVLDVSLWRKEKVCCGIIFRGLNNEVAIFPKLFRPRQCALHRHKLLVGRNSSLAGTVAASSSAGQDDDDSTSTTSTNVGKQAKASVDEYDAISKSPPALIAATTGASLTSVAQAAVAADEDDDDSNDQRHPRSTKSGSLSSSSDSSTSGTGSLEPFDALELSYWNPHH